MAELRTDLVVHQYGRSPGAAPTLLLLHGLTDSAGGWVDAVRRWQDSYAVVTVDQRGHGESPRFTAEQRQNHPGELMVEDALALVEQLDRPVVVGHSLGGAVALDVGVRRPDLVRGLVLEDPAPLGPDEPVHDPDEGQEFLAGLRPSLETADDEELYRLRKEQHPDWPEAELLVTGTAEQQMDLDYLGNGEWKPLTPWPQLLERLRVPTLVVSGDRFDELCVTEELERDLTELGNRVVTLARVPGAGHCVRRDQPRAYHQVVDPWLAQLLTT